MSESTRQYFSYTIVYNFDLLVIKEHVKIYCYIYVRITVAQIVSNKMF